MNKLSLLIGLLYFFFANTNAQDNKGILKFPTEEDIIYDLCFTKSGEAIGVADGSSIKVFSLPAGELIRDFKNGHNSQIISIDISNDNTKLVSGGIDSTVVIWDFNEERILESLECNGIITSVCISPDGKYLAFGGSENNVTVYDLVNQNTVHIFSDHSDDITSVAFSPDGQLIASSSGDQSINIYSNGSLTSTLLGHKDWVRDISFDSDGIKLMSCGDEGKIITWDISDVNNPRIINDSRHGLNWLLSVDFFQDDNTYTYGDFKGNVKIIGHFGAIKLISSRPSTKYDSNQMRVLF